MIRWLERSLEGLLQRLGPRYLSVLRLLVLLIVVLVADSLVGLLLYVHFDPDLVEFTRVMLVSNGVILCVALAWLMPKWRRFARPIELVLAGARDPDHLVAAWQSIKTFTLDHLRSGVAAGILALVLATAYGTWEVDFSALDAAIAIFAQLITLVFITALAWPVIELAQRPVRRMLGPLVPRGQPSQPEGPTLGIRVALSILGISLVTGAGVAIVATIDDTVESFGGLLLVATATSLSFGGLLAVLLSRSLLAPLDDLLDTARLVTAGRLDLRVAVTSSDEIGEVAGAFNEMLDAIERSSAEVRASRERIVAASDAERRRIERNIHDGAQQQLVALALELRTMQARLGYEPEAVSRLEAALDHLQTALDDLRELAQGLHPSILSTDGLAPALQQLAERATGAVTVEADGQRWPEMIESTAWFVASEALANVAKYAHASSVSVSAKQRDGHLVVTITDDGIGGAHADEGSGLRGLADRVEAVGGLFDVVSPPGAGTILTAWLPVDHVHAGTVVVQ